MKVAYVCEPQIGGTYTSFRQIREKLLPMGIDYRCVPPTDGREFRGTPFENDEGVDYVEYPSSDPAGMAKCLAGRLAEGGYAAAVLLPGCYPFVSSLPPYLPRSVRCIARMPHNARGVYRPTALMAEHYNRIVAVGPRLKEDLTGGYGVPETKVEVIGNGIDAERFRPGDGATARNAAYVGRIEDVQKNVFLLPKILKRALARDAGARLAVVGDGPDAEELRARFAAEGLDGRYEMLGRISPEKMPEALRGCGVFALPSRFEGCSNSTLEAMASGCVPILSRLRGVSDNLAEEGKSGFLVAPGDWRGMGDAWGRLMEDEALWRGMRHAARERICGRFTIEATAEAYGRLFRAILQEADGRPAARPMEEYEVHPGMGPNWRRWIPDGIKKRLRTVAARMGMSP